MSREAKLEEILKAVIEDFDQVGCSAGLGTVRTVVINRARAMLDMTLLFDDEDDSSNG